MSKTYIIGAGGHGKVILDILERQGYDIAGFLDDDETIHGTEINGYPVIDSVSKLEDIAAETVIAVGHNPTRKKLFNQINEYKDIDLINTIHPETIINSHVDIGSGNMIVAGAIINSNTVIKDNVIINTGATVDHDCLIESHVHISPGVNLGGNVTVREGSHIGIGASVLPGITIGENVTVGAGAVVISNLEANSVYAGVPAKKIRDL
ncbi:acetyltransferase [Halanaerobiaceae bacterium Z-7014]|uniref:Acetyltransferase n=1 Tax=Halonatronomonas betaini TaxID=2778430 RepID=A0A931APE6_9FIRM|nr:acetyltransferase [Halonatronomonas betaini]MBF8436533.1 acetyltransferase [Halonatronomonas betaini]